MENKNEPLTHEEKIQAITSALKEIGYTILDFKTDMDAKTIPSGIIDIRIIPSRMYL
jgi:hypothetical protein